MQIIRSSSKATHERDRLIVGIAQIAPICLNRQATLEKVASCVEMAAAQGCQLLCFGEALAPGYPFWIELTDGARFNNAKNKAIYARYLDQGVVIERGDLTAICQLAAQHRIAIYLGVMERASDRGGHSLYCSLVYIDMTGHIASVHRKLQPTFEERLAWAAGDGHGLVVHDLAPFRVGGLNCWENWMPLSRAALYAQGENLHISVWPGAVRNTESISRFIAQESRSYVVAASGLMRPSDFPADFEGLHDVLKDAPEFYGNGGSAIAAPDGAWLIEPVAGVEALLVAELDHAVVRGERQNFDPAGHYSRPDVTRLVVDRRRQGLVEFVGRP